MMLGGGPVVRWSSCRLGSQAKTARIDLSPRLAWQEWTVRGLASPASKCCWGDIGLLSSGVERQ